MRGQRTFDNIIKIESEGSQRGRNNTLLSRRNNCLIDRYYYYGHHKGKCYEDILLALVDEFFLSPDRMNRIIQENISRVRERMEQSISVGYLQKQWPQLRWH